MSDPSRDAVRFPTLKPTSWRRWEFVMTVWGMGFVSGFVMAMMGTAIIIEWLRRSGH